MNAYLVMFLASLLAASPFPTVSEGVLGGLVATGEHDIMLLWTVATIGNTLGSVVNWGLGRWCLHWKDRPWFPLKPAQLEKAHERFQSWGSWSLLLSWVPFIGDPLTLAAGFLRVSFPLFVSLVALGKGARYAVVASGVNAFL